MNRSNDFSRWLLPLAAGVLRSPAVFLLNSDLTGLRGCEEDWKFGSVRSFETQSMNTDDYLSLFDELDDNDQTETVEHKMHKITKRHKNLDGDSLCLFVVIN